MKLHVHRAALVVALAALLLGVAALVGASSALASAQAFTIVNLGGDPSIPDVHGPDGVTFDVSSITGTGFEMVVVGIPGAASTWRLTAPNTGTVTVAGYSPVTFSGTPSLFGGDGDDTFVFAGGSVSGTIVGGLGANVLDYSASGTGIMVNLATGSATRTGGISAIRSVIGGNGADTLTGDGNDNIFTGGPGRDTINGYAGSDTLVETRNANFTLSNTDLTIGAEGDDILSGIEAARLTGGVGGNTLDASTFTAGRAVLDGAGGNDTLRSGSGRDVLIGGPGDDTMSGDGGGDWYRGGPGANTIIEAATTGGRDSDTVEEYCDGDFTLTVDGLDWDDGSYNAASLVYIEDIWMNGGPGDNQFDMSALRDKNFHVAGDGGFDSVRVDPHGYAIDQWDGGAYIAALNWTTTLDAVEAVTFVGVTMPVLELPGDMTLEATSAAGALASFTVTATDAAGGSLAVSCSSSSGSVFPLGLSNVLCSATDASGNTIEDTFSITVVDTTAPVLHLPDDITVRATSSAGAGVDFAATVDDACDGAVTVTCDPVSGSTFPVGSTIVNCTASDAAGNKATGSFTVTVLPLYTWTDFLQPINLDGSSVFKLKSTVPVKFALTGDNAGITDLAARFSCAKVSNGIVGDCVEAIISSAATTGNLFRYDATSGQYIFNWGTKGLTAGTYQIRVDLGDGVAHTVLVSLR